MSDSLDSRPAVATQATAPLRFLAGGRLVGLWVDGREVFRETPQHSGFYLAWFDGSKVREIPLPHVTQRENGGLDVVADTVFPRLRFHVSDIRGSLHVILTRVEGMPVERDVSIGFRFGLSMDCTVTAAGAGVIVAQPTREDWRVFWTGTGNGRQAADFGGFILTPKDRVESPETNRLG